MAKLHANKISKRQTYITQKGMEHPKSDTQNHSQDLPHHSCGVCIHLPDLVCVILLKLEEFFDCNSATGD